ncbi:MAG: ATP-binding protein [Pontiella sp.]
MTIGACFLPSFTKSVIFPASGTTELARPVYGPTFTLFLLYMVGSIFVLGFNVLRDRKKLEGSQRLETEFLVFASLSGLVVGIFLGTIVSLITSSSIFIPIANAASVFTVSIIVAYGIAVHKILTVSALLRRATAYALLTAFLSVVYYVTWLITVFICNFLAITSTFPSHLIPALIVVFSMLPARRRMQQATDFLFSNSIIFDVQTTLKKAGTIFQSVTTINALMHQFSELLKEAVDAEYISILTYQNEKFIQGYPLLLSKDEKSISSNATVVQMIRSTKDPISRDGLQRTRVSPTTREAIDQLNQYNISIATGTFSKGELTGLVLLGSKRGGRIYDKTEQDTLQILCNQFAVALENAQLYTEVQDSKIRNEIMLDQLVSGVIVANPDRQITLFNHEAQRITGIEEYGAVGQQIDILPWPITRALENALETQSGKRNEDAVLFAADEDATSTSIRMGSAFLFGHDDKPMGALLVFTDMTELKSLEEQVRRTDQLSSVGTLAAGMAHEIKNPLVTIKTFTQLLPQRYADEDFRNDFSSLVAHEVARIDGIVNELLSFSKPAKPHLVPMNLQDTIEQTLKLTHEQMVQKNITLSNKCAAKDDAISGDAKLLSQALVNLYLNAIDAIGQDGTITVVTSNCNYRFANTDSPDNPISKKCIRLLISDSGKGIKQDDLQKIFDPFFTSKSEGTGMGLSVAHGVITEHHGVIEVDSVTGSGTNFNLYIPILDEDTIA